MNKKNKYTIDHFLMLLFLIIEVRFFYLISLPSILGGAGSNKFLQASVSFFIFIFYVVVLKKGNFTVGYFGWEILSFFILLFFSSLYSYFFYNYSITTVVWPCLPFLILLMYFPLKDWLKNQSYRQFFYTSAEIIMSVLSFLFIMQCLCYNGEASVFLKLNGAINDYYLSNTHLMLRIYSVFDGFIRIFILIVASKIIQKKFKNCIKDIISFILMLFAVIIVDQSRMYLLIIILSCAVMFFVFNRKTLEIRPYFILVGGGIVGILSFILLFRSFVMDINLNTGSIYARTEAIIFYIKNFIQNPSLLGMGLVVPEKGSEYFTYILGSQGIYHYDDVGIFGLFASLGVIGVLWYLWILFKLCTIFYKKLYKNELAIGILVCFILSMPTMIYTNQSRICSMLMTLVVFETELYDYKNNITGKCGIKLKEKSCIL